MSIAYTIKSEGELLTVEASGVDDSAEEVMAYGAAVVDAAVEAKSRHILCDERNLMYRLRLTQTFEAANFIAAYAPRVARTAIVCKSECMSDAKFWETVVGNRGLLVRVFDNLATARGWLETPASLTFAGSENEESAAADTGPA